MPAAVVHALQPGTVSGLEISPLLGGFSAGRVGIQGHELVRHGASLDPRSRVNSLHAPLLVDSPDIRDALPRDSSIQAARRAAARAELALTCAPVSSIGMASR